MKKKVVMITTDGKKLEKEITVRNYDHFLTQLKYKSKKQTNKKVYNRQAYKRGE